MGLTWRRNHAQDQQNKRAESCDTNVSIGAEIFNTHFTELLLTKSKLSVYFIAFDRRRYDGSIGPMEPLKFLLPANVSVCL